jgi:hypothetical protein
MQNQVNIPLGLDNTDEIACAFLLRKVSALISPTGKETVVPIQVFACDSCNHVNKEFLPIDKP